MPHDFVNALTELVKALTRLVQVAGTGPSAVVMVICVALLVGVPWLREHLRNKRVDMVIEHKEKEVLRLAEDNRRYREAYLARLGFPAGALTVDAQDSKAVKKAQEKESGGGLTR